MIPITQAEEARWLYTGAVALVDLLKSKEIRGLPVLTWTVAGRQLKGHLADLGYDGDLARQRADFARWVEALAATPTETAPPRPGMSTLLWGVREDYGPHKVKVTLRTELFDDESGATP